MERKTKAVAEKTGLSSVTNAIRLIKTFSEEDYEIGISDLGKRLKLPKSTVHRLAGTLVDAGILEQSEENGRYRLGLVVFELSSLVRRKMDFYNEAKPVMMALRDKTGESVHLAILVNSSVMYINSSETNKAIRMRLEVGVRKPAHSTAAGKAILAFQPADVLARVLAEGLNEHTANTIVDPEEFKRQLAAIRTRGIAMADEENEVGVRSLAAPVRDHSGDVIAAIGIAGPVQRLTKKVMATFAPDVVSAAEAVSARLGYHPLRSARMHLIA